jgi:hypothetical protein
LTIDSSQTSFPSTLTLEPFLILLALGFAVGGLGHLFGVRFLVAVGVMLVLAATLVGPAVLVFLMR